MKKYFLIIVLIIVFNTVKAEEDINTGFGLGMQLVEYQDDFGLGINLTSPFFVDDGIGLRLRANYMFNQAIVDGSYDWVPYSNISLGVIGVGGFVTERIRLYGEGGVIVLIPSSDISSEDSEFGGYGIFGFEFFFSKFGNYFIELGSVGTGAVADQIIAEPIYSNGFSISTGFRFFFK